MDTDRIVELRHEDFLQIETSASFTWLIYLLIWRIKTDPLKLKQSLNHTIR